MWVLKGFTLHRFLRCPCISVESYFRWRRLDIWKCHTVLMTLLWLDNSWDALYKHCCSPWIKLSVACRRYFWFSPNCCKMSTDAFSTSVDRKAEDRTLALFGCFHSAYVVKTELFNCVESLACLSIEGNRDCGIGVGQTEGIWFLLAVKVLVSHAC